MQKGHRADYFIEDHERSGHQRASVKLRRAREGCGLHTIDEEGPPRAHRIGGNCAWLRKQMKAGETIEQLAIGLFPHKFVARVAPPEIYAGDLEELAGSAAEELDQSVGIEAFGGFAGKLQEEFLKGVVGIGQDMAFG